MDMTFESPDGYVRMTYSRFLAMEFAHVWSELDPGAKAEISDSDCDRYEAITGHTELISISPPEVSIGWDWALSGSPNRPCCSLMGAPFSNLMFTDEQHRDLGPLATAELLATWLSFYDWRPDALASIASAAPGFNPFAVQPGRHLHS